jgi:hypothetical protein
MPMTFTVRGMLFPASSSAFRTMAVVPPQQGTSMRATVTVVMETIALTLLGQLASFHSSRYLLPLPVPGIFPSQIVRSRKAVELS